MEEFENKINLLKSEIENALREHNHSGVQSKRINTQDIFDTGKNISAIRYLQLEVFAPATNVATGDGKYYIHIPAEWNRFYLVEVHAMVVTAGITGTTDIQIANVTDSWDLLSTKITINSGETDSSTATPAVIDKTGEDEVTENDVLRIDVDAISTTPPKGLVITLGFSEFRK